MQAFIITNYGYIFFFVRYYSSGRAFYGYQSSVGLDPSSWRALRLGRKRCPLPAMAAKSRAHNVQGAPPRA